MKLYIPDILRHNPVPALLIAAVLVLPGAASCVLALLI